MRHKVVIAGMTLDPNTQNPILLLQVEEDRRMVPVWIGLPEAAAIASALQNIAFDRPMTHDLFRAFVEKAGYRVTSVEVSGLRGNTFFARILFTPAGGGGQPLEMDARPSDAIALALRFDAPVYVTGEVLARSREIAEVRVEEMDVMDDTEQGRKWAEYLAGLSPEEFGKV
ncbi:MAG: hypothetical protein CSB33_04210 [Desulfobacterales bacterium]|nr:MAG: hypothetical protein CSB33_04210 [Desulfobacterales bacterium]